MHKRTKVCSAVLAALGSATSLTCAPVYAQATLDRVEITGSSIRRIDAETALPVQIIKREQIERTGATSVVDLLQKLPAIQGSFAESNAVGGGTSFNGVSIHNIGETRTLVLLNGHRLTQFGGQSLTGFAAAADLNAIPFAAIERIEILTDGASALYGADAIAGVVNFITRRYTSEGDISLGYSSPRGGARETRVSISKGFGDINTDGFSVMLSAQHDERTKLDATSRNFGNTARAVFTDSRGRTLRAQNTTPSSIPGNVLADNGVELKNLTLLAGGACPDKSLRVTDNYSDDIDGDGVLENYTDDYCSFNFVGELEIYPVRKRDTLLATVNKKIGDQELFADVLFAKSQAISRIAPVPGSLLIPTGSALFNQYLAPAGFGGADLTGDGVADGTLVFYRLYDLGKRTSDNRSKFYDVALGSKGALFGWDYNLTYSHSESDAKENIAGYPGALAVANLRASGLLDPFVGPGQQSAAAQQAINATAYKGYWDGGVAKLDTITLRGSRELMAMPSGPLLFGAGISAQKEKFQSKPSLFAQAKLADPVAGTLCDPNNPALPCDQRFGDEASTEPYAADRKAYAVFGELVIPVTKTIEATTSVRFDNYSDFGDSTTAKASFRWQPDKSVLVRGSLGTGFHAPTVPQVNATQQPFGVTNEPYPCTPELRQLATELGANCQPAGRQYDQFAGGNPALKPEKSNQASLGIRFEPSTDVSLGADLWHVGIRDAFGQLTEDVVFADPLAYRDAFTTKRDTGTGVNYIAFLAGNLNLGKSFYTGLDLDVVGRAKTPIGDLTSQVATTYMIRETQQLLENGPYYSAIGNHAEIGSVTFRWQGRWTNTLNVGNWSHTLQVNFKSGYTDAPTRVEVLDASGNVIDVEDDYRLKVKRSATMDWQTQWRPIKDLSLTVGVLNLLDTKPPLAISNGGLNRGQQFGFDDRYYDSRGRTAYINASYKF